MRALVGLVAVMGVLIVVGVAGLAVTIVHRLGASPAQADTLLEEPAGTRMGGPLRRWRTILRCCFRAAGRTGWC